ncbi:MAG: hypothetical protein P4L71_14740 [Acetobacteraceae bacterium]|nr:hypothetical protein [Acetobacteraceae bacterium]
MALDLIETFTSTTGPFGMPLLLLTLACWFALAITAATLVIFAVVFSWRRRWRGAVLSCDAGVDCFADPAPRHANSITGTR